MKYLLDTCTFYWFASGVGLVSEKAADTIANDQFDIAVSMVSFWEIAIKASIGKLPMRATLTDFEHVAMTENISVLPISVSCLEILKSLPFHHNDPFDRTIISSAIDGAWTILTPDAVFDNYRSVGLEREW